MMVTNALDTQVYQSADNPTNGEERPCSMLLENEPRGWWHRVQGNGALAF